MRVRWFALIVFFSIVFWSLLTSAATVTLVWNRSVGTNVAGYNVYCGGWSRAYTNKFNVGNSTNATISGLIEGRTYFFAATAYDAKGLESDYSNEVSYGVPNGGGAPVQTNYVRVSLELRSATNVLGPWPVVTNVVLLTRTNAAGPEYFWGRVAITNWMQ